MHTLCLLRTLSLLRTPLASRLPPPTLSLSSAVPFTPDGASEFAREPEDAAWAMGQMQQIKLDVPGIPVRVPTTFIRSGAEGKPKILFLHGADSSALEWRFIMKRCNEDYDCWAVDWFSGGWTDRTAFVEALRPQPTPPQPWPVVRNHIQAFWEQAMGAEPCVLVGTSLGGAVALDVATNAPGIAAKLVLVDAGGVSYKSPQPDEVTALYRQVGAVKALVNLIQQNLPSKAARLACLHRRSPLWREAGEQYLRSGGYQRAVGPEMIQRVPQETLVIWGSDDPILPLADAYEFERLLPKCDAVHVINGSGHSPQLDNPQPVAELIRSFCEHR